MYKNYLCSGYGDKNDIRFERITSFIAEHKEVRYLKKNNDLDGFLAIVVSVVVMFCWFFLMACMLVDMSISDNFNIFNTVTSVYINVSKMFLGFTITVLIPIAAMLVRYYNTQRVVLNVKTAIETFYYGRFNKSSVKEFDATEYSIYSNKYAEAVADLIRGLGYDASEFYKMKVGSTTAFLRIVGNRTPLLALLTILVFMIAVTSGINYNTNSMLVAAARDTGTSVSDVSNYLAMTAESTKASEKMLFSKQLGKLISVADYNRWVSASHVDSKKSLIEKMRPHVMVVNEQEDDKHTD